MDETFAASATRLAGLAGALLGWRPGEFWTATPAELAAVIGASSGDEAGGGMPADGGDLARLREMARARAIAEARLERRWVDRARTRITVPWREMGLRPGDRLALADGDWQVAGVELEKMALALDLTRHRAAPLVEAEAASAGRNVGDPDLIHGPTSLLLLDLPALDDGLDAQPRLLAAAAGTSPGWRRAAFELSLDGGTSYGSLGETAPPAVMGMVLDALDDGEAALIDGRAAVTVELLHDQMWLEGRPDDALVAGENMALIGDEIVQFGSAVQTGPAQFLLSRLVRGRRGTEWAMADHAAGEPFLLLDPASLRRIDVPVASLGAEIELLARGVGDETSASAGRILTGASIRPPAPVHLSARRLPHGDIAILWVRRSRLGWRWIDGGDVPRGEESEAWRLTLMPDAGTPRTVETVDSAYTYSLAQQQADGAEVAMVLALEIAQLGTLAASAPPATASITL